MDILVYIFFMAAIFILTSICILAARKNVLNNGVWINAEVVKSVHLAMSARRGGGHYYFTVFKYSVDGHAYETTYQVGSRKPKYEDGEIVEIVYSNKNHKKIAIADDKTPTIVSIVLLSVGCVLLALGIFFSII